MPFHCSLLLGNVCFWAEIWIVCLELPILLVTIRVLQSTFLFWFTSGFWNAFAYLQQRVCQLQSLEPNTVLVCLGNCLWSTAESVIHLIRKYRSCLEKQLLVLICGFLWTYWKETSSTAVCNILMQVTVVFCSEHLTILEKVHPRMMWYHLWPLWTCL